MSFNWQQALGTNLGRKVENILDKRSSKNIDIGKSVEVTKLESFQKFFPFKTVVNGVAVHNDECTFTSYIKVGRMNFANKDDKTKELILGKYDETLNIIDESQIIYKKGKLSPETLLYSMEQNKSNLVGFEREFFDIQKEHYQDEIVKRNISTTDRLIVLQCKITRGKYKDKLQEAIKTMNDEQLSFIKKLHGMKVNYIHICNTYEVLEIFFNEFTDILGGSVIEKLKIPSSGVFITKFNEIEADDNNYETTKLVTKGDDLLAVGEWNFKDLLIDAPIHFAEDHVRLGKKYLGIKCITTYSDNITEKTFEEVLNQSKFNLTLSIHIEQQDKGDVIQDTQGRLNKIERELASGVTDKASKNVDKSKLEDGLIKLNNDTCNFLVKIYFGVLTDTIQDMDTGLKYINKLIISKNMKTYLPEFEMKDAFLSLMPFGVDYFDKKLDVPTRIGENFLTQALACINIFSGTDLVHTSKRALRYGYDRDTNNFITADKVKNLTAPNGLILGTPGTGKTSTAEHEIGEEILTLPPGDQIFTVDYIGEYSPFCQQFKYPEMFFDLHSGNYINCMDLNPYDANPLNDKADKFVEFLEILLYRKFNNIELNAIDRAFYNTYKEYGITETNQHGFYEEVDNVIGDNTLLGVNHEKIRKIKNDCIPILEDFQKFINMEGDEGQYIGKELDLYVRGTHRYLNERTTFNLEAKYANFNLTTVRNRMKPSIFSLIKEKIEDKGRYNFRVKNKRMIYLYYDEMHRYFRNATLGEILARDYKEGRKEGLVPTGITQNPQDLLRYEDGVVCLVNAKFVILLGMDKASRELIAEYIELSEAEKDAFNGDVCNPGDGLLVFGGDRIPIHISCSEWELREFDTTAHD